jgi:hypothetical protein
MPVSERLCPRTTRARRVWCALTELEVQVEFEERGFPGLSSPFAVKSCTAFDPPTAVACRRRCVDPAFRRQWPAALAAQRG